MPIPSITLAEFNKIASGQQNAGQVDFKTNSDGEFTGGLVKINNHIIRKSLNGVHLTGERVVAIKEAFLDALQKANVRAEDLQTIRAELGMSGELNADADANAALPSRTCSTKTGMSAKSISQEIGGSFFEFLGTTLNRLVKGAKVLGENDDKNTNVDNIPLPEEEENQIDLEV